MPSDFDAREGLKLTPEYTIGKEIGGGVQGRVLALNDGNGEKTNKLLKVNPAVCMHIPTLVHMVPRPDCNRRNLVLLCNCLF